MRFLPFIMFGFITVTNFLTYDLYYYFLERCIFFKQSAVCIRMLLRGHSFTWSNPAARIALWTARLTTVISGVEYFFVICLDVYLGSFDMMKLRWCMARSRCYISWQMSADTYVRTFARKNLSVFHFICQRNYPFSPHHANKS